MLSQDRKEVRVGTTINEPPAYTDIAMFDHLRKSCLIGGLHYERASHPRAGQNLIEGVKAENID